ncbi:putative Mg2+ transporter-C (MgtC) family protein [Methylohalomonas lacus]|uniref:Protein MgtC n=1 Tax=Methylohalomonas lacus TaxID=398773 RepID=A0AAE3HMZ9_9GAMM|nr:MgtC/SapB family protein [Methylohalomonas lacus]MCS3903478.1 putative Mg2+ transporter-C (MgtC) family protein [Methylohalomonas lacus]
MEYAFDDLRWSLYLTNLAVLSVAFLLALPLGWNRESETRNFGLRTFPLVAVASCGYMLIGQDVVGDDANALGKIMYGLMTGIGFIGGGAILKDGANVRGTATAASIWNTGAIGMAVAFHRYEIAIALAMVNFAILRFMNSIKSSE